MITKKEFQRCFCDYQYEKACKGKTDVTISVEKSSYTKDLIIREYEDRGWELFDIGEELVNYGKKEVKADWKTGWHGERIELVPAGSGSEAAYEDVVGSDGEWHRGKRLTVTVDDVRDHWKMHFKRSESNYQKHKENEEKMLKYATDIDKYDPSEKKDISPEEYTDGEVARLERVYLDKNPAPGKGLAIFFMVLGILGIGFTSFLLFAVGVPEPTASTIRIALIIASSVFALGVLLMAVAIVLKRKHKQKMRAWISTQYDIKGKAEEESKRRKKHCEMIESLLNKLY